MYTFDRFGRFLAFALLAAAAFALLGCASDGACDVAEREPVVVHVGFGSFSPINSISNIYFCNWVIDTIAKDVYPCVILLVITISITY